MNMYVFYVIVQDSIEDSTYSFMENRKKYPKLTKHGINFGVTKKQQSR